MSENTKIEWADHTFNPWTGCTKVSPGCDHCYAEGWAKRSGTVRWGAGEPRRRTTEANWRLPLKWNAQAESEGRRFRVFCSSLADVFDNEIDPTWRADLFRLIEATPHLDWLLLTKRIGNAAEMMFLARGGHLPLLPNVWIGATVVNQAEADRDIPKLLQVPARVRFLSVEPMLGPVDLSTHRGAKALPLYWEGTDADGLMPVHCGLTGRHLGDFARRGWVKTSENMSPWVDWVIAGGESGPSARPMHPDWARSLRDQCKAAGVPFLFKQWGEHLGALQDGNPHAAEQVINATDGPMRVGKKAAGRLLDGRTHDEFPHGAAA